MPLPLAEATIATFLIGARDLEPPEAALLRRSAISFVAPAKIPEGLRAVLAKTPLDDALAYIHLDLDVLDPRAVGKANWFPVAGGLSADQLVDAIIAIREYLPVGAAALTSYAPEYDADQAVCHAAFDAIDAIVASEA